MRLSKVLMDGGSGLNILYFSTLDMLGIFPSSICPNNAPFYGTVPRKKVVPLRCIWLNITFSEPDNFRKEFLTFEVVDFPRVYHTLFGHPCFTKFMVVSNYTYLKLKMPSLKESSSSMATLSRPTSMSKTMSLKQQH
jgi:hypothetical protein